MPEDQIESAENRARARLRQERDDLNNEVAGRDTGRIKRFVAPEHIGGGTTDSSKDNDDFAFAAINQILTMQQQEQIERLQQEFALYDEATKLALEEIDQEIEQAEQKQRYIKENATTLADGRRVYRDEANGQFYDEEDNRLSETDELEAHQRYKTGESSRQTILSADKRIGALYKERTEVIDFRTKQAKLKDDLKENPDDVGDIEEELESMPAPERVRKHYSGPSKKTTQELTDEASTSFAKRSDNNGINSKYSLTPAFSHAGGLEQTAPDLDSRDIKPQSVPGMVPV